MSKPETCVCCGRVIPEGSQYCVICGNKVKGKQTNYDRIRNMSVDELARFIQCISGDVERYVPFCQNKKVCSDRLDNNEYIPEIECFNCMKYWLESEVDTE